MGKLLSSAYFLARRRMSATYVWPKRGERSQPARDRNPFIPEA